MEASGAEEHPGTLIVKQPGYASGDQFGILVALLSKPEMQVVIGRNRNPTAQDRTPDKSHDIEKFYRDSGIDQSRIHIAYAESMETRVQWHALDRESWEVAENEFGITDRHNQEEIIEGNEAGTRYVAENFSEADRDKLRDSFGLSSDVEDNDARIHDWLAKKGIRLQETGNRVLVLWSRFSGKKYNWKNLRGLMENDTSFEGVRQIIRQTVNHYDTILITGDKHPTKEGKWSSLTDQMRRETNTDKIHEITEFWNENSAELKAWEGNSRTRQYRLYDYLHRKHRLTHLGFRSGNLEAVALIGHKVRYIEDSSAFGGSRMTAWHDTSDGKTRSGGMAPGYERIQINETSTGSGRHSNEYRELHGKEAWLRFSAADGKPLTSYFKESGFALRDLQTILDEIANGDDLDDPIKRNEFELFRLEHLAKRLTTLRNRAAEEPINPEYNAEQLNWDQQRRDYVIGYLDNFIGDLTYTVTYYQQLPADDSQRGSIKEYANQLFWSLKEIEGALKQYLH
ncbi:hypothetical protein SAMN05421805_1011709 [Saccharopolyspora antimicrobica]|uniref:Uncharacterized protein n=2 Tax=Saccharopolyspora antimicrobica TaxID=455193 RepID=A0A1I4U3J4_9PSEU|nr:hypothetical protein ATL45_7107 [Saccharopolyspora antimicrobica]SFM83578.1 hypothetical protein SAMN05421805_1011709 [Saccharopolyspora antimicrobica]